MQQEAIGGKRGSFTFAGLALAALSLLGGPPAGAQPAASGEEPVVEEPVPGEAPGVTVTDSGNRVVYGPQYFSQYSVISAADMLQRIPGVGGLLRGGGGGFGGGGGRGFGSSGSQVLINGKRLSGKSIDVGSTLGNIQARQVERIEVIRGTVEDLDVRSQGRVVNVVLSGELVTGFGSWEGELSRHSDGRDALGAEVNYSGNLNAMSYVVSAETDPGRGYSTGTDLFYTPENELFERQAEVNVDESDEYEITANTSFSLGNGDILNVNGLYETEDEQGRRDSEEFSVSADEELFVSSLGIESVEEGSSWELGGDYEHVFESGNTFTGLWVATSSSADEESFIAFTPAGEPNAVDERRLVSRESSERILRGTYDWGITDSRSFESGAEIAVNTVDRAIQLFEDTNGDGSLEETTLFNQASEVQETRVEAFTTYTWQGRENLLVETSLDLESSEITQQGGDVSRSRSFTYVRPRFVARYDVNAQTQLRGRIERSVNQLDFGAFTASFTNDDNRLDVISAGNPELVPEKSWDYELTYERRLDGDAGFVSVTGSYHDVEDREAAIPLIVRNPDGTLEERTAPGNIGEGERYQLEIDTSLRLGWLNLDRAVLEGSVSLSETSVVDPFTGEERDFNWSSPYGWRLSFRHDTSWRGLSYGFSTGNRGEAEQFERDYRQIGEDDPDLEIFAEVQPMENLTVRFEVDRVLQAQGRRERFQYVGNRGDGVLERREVRFSEPSRQITLSVQGLF